MASRDRGKKVKRRTVCLITGTRAEFGLLKPVMMRIRESDNLSLQVIATGMHLLPEYGNTVSEISRNGIPISARVPMIVSGNDKTSMTLSIGLGIISFTQVLNDLDPDIVLVLGDRFETFAAAVAASFSGRVVAHMAGGDTLQAGYDEYVRHAITKISHIHFPATDASAERIIRMGEERKNVFITGSTALDTINHLELPPPEKIRKKYHLEEKDFILVVQHPISTDPTLSREQMRTTLDAILELGYQMLVLYPNNDPGGAEIIEVINNYEKSSPDKIHAYRSIPFEDYLGIMQIASVMVGNSSSGIIESPAFHLPVVNVGNRQKGRERAENVLDVPHEKEKIKRSIQTALSDGPFLARVQNCTNPYGDGHASERIVDVLSTIPLDEGIFQKRITY